MLDTLCCVCVCVCVCVFVCACVCVCVCLFVCLLGVEDFKGSWFWCGLEGESGGEELKPL